MNKVRRLTLFSLMLSMVVYYRCCCCSTDEHGEEEHHAHHSTLDWRDFPLEDEQANSHYRRQYSLTLSSDSELPISTLPSSLPTLLYTERYISDKKGHSVTGSIDSSTSMPSKSPTTWIWFLAGGPGDSSHDLKKLVMAPGSFYTDLFNETKDKSSSNGDVVICFPHVRGTVPWQWVQAHPSISSLAIQLITERRKENKKKKVHRCKQELALALRMNKNQHHLLTNQIARDVVSLITRVSFSDPTARHILHGFSYGSYLAIFIARLIKIDGIVMDGGIPLTICNSNPVSNDAWNNFKHVLLADALIDRCVEREKGKINYFQKYREVIELGIDTLKNIHDNDTPRNIAILAYFKSRLDGWSVDEAIRGLSMCPEKISVNWPEGKTNLVDSREIALIALYHVGQLTKTLDSASSIKDKTWPPSPDQSSFYDDLESTQNGLKHMCLVIKRALVQYVSKIEEEPKPETETRTAITESASKKITIKSGPFGRSEPVYAALLKELAHKQHLEPLVESPPVFLLSGSVDSKSTPPMMDVLHDQVLKMTDCSLVKMIRFNGRGHIQTLPLNRLRPDSAMREALEPMLIQFYFSRKLPTQEQVKKAIQLAQERSSRTIKWGSTTDILNSSGLHLWIFPPHSNVDKTESRSLLRQIYEMYPVELTILMITIPALVVGLVALLILKRYLAIVKDRRRNQTEMNNVALNSSSLRRSVSSTLSTTSTTRGLSLLLA